MIPTGFLRSITNFTRLEAPKIVNRLKYFPPNRELDRNHMVNKKISFKLTNGANCTVDAVIQDLMPKSGKPIATVVATPGIPSDFLSFRYIYPYLVEHNVRFIGVTFPGQGFTVEQPGMTFDNIEFCNYAKAVVDEMCPTGDIVVLSHSRGSEYAIRLTADLVSTREVRGMVLINPLGFRSVGVARATLDKKLLVWCHKTFPTCKGFWEECAQRMIWRMKFVAKSPSRAMASIRVYMHDELEKQKPLYEKINAAEHTQVVVGYAADDHEVCPLDITREASQHWKGFTEVICEDTSEEKDVETTDKAVQLLMNGTKTVALHYKDGGHFLNGKRNTSFVRCILALLRIDKY